ncbi:helix-turn-helix domain-containing protein [Microvirga roseola]|uniref:helix-turn-helix domain-containing protein n=1 Tax=Microvirga roseola TaxID=2883126 RepID=UPI001E307322|nr:helix-turn-helix domain-containing protein [Microvirga roseola]
MRRFSIDVLVHPGVSTGAVTTLVYLISRCGRNKQLTTCTSWLAADLGVSPRTIQNHYRQLEQAGFLARSSPDRRGRTTIYLTPLVEVRPVRNGKAEILVAHDDGAKKNSRTKDIDSKERGANPRQRKGAEREASGPSGTTERKKAQSTPIGAGQEAEGFRSTGTAHPLGSSSKALRSLSFRQWLPKNPVQWDPFAGCRRPG